MTMYQNKMYFLKKVKEKHNLESSVCYAAIGFIEVNNQSLVLDGYVVDKYFINATTEEIYPIEKLSLINNVENFDD